MKPAINISRLSPIQNVLQLHNNSDFLREAERRGGKTPRTHQDSVSTSMHTLTRNEDTSDLLSHFGSQQIIPTRTNTEVQTKFLINKRSALSSMDQPPLKFQSIEHPEYSPLRRHPNNVKFNSQAKSNEDSSQSMNLLSTYAIYAQTKTPLRTHSPAFLPSLVRPSVSPQFSEHSQSPVKLRMESPMLQRQLSTKPSTIGISMRNTQNKFLQQQSFPHSSNDFSISKSASSNRTINIHSKSNLSPSYRNSLDKSSTKSPIKSRKHSTIRDYTQQNTFLPNTSYIDPEFILPDDMISKDIEQEVISNLTPSKQNELNFLETSKKFTFRAISKDELQRENDSISVLKGPRLREALKERMHQRFILKNRKTFTKEDFPYLDDMMRQTHFKERSDEELIFPGNEGIEQQFRIVSKRIQKLQDRDSFLQQKSSFLVELVSAWNESPSLLPKKMMLLEDNKNCSELNLSNIPMPTKLAEVFARVLIISPYSTHLLSITANNVQLTDENLAKILGSFPMQTHKLALQNNLLTSTAMKQIISTVLFQLTDLDVQGNKINFEGAKKLFGQLLTRKFPLKKLNLSSNCIDDKAAASLSHVIASASNCPSEIYIRWNQLHQSGGCQIAVALKNASEYLKVLDLSNNHIGSSTNEKSPRFSRLTQSIGELFGSAISSNTSLIHLDLSNCGLTEVDCASIQKGLKYNQTLYGLHIDGNESFVVDYAGFMRKAPWLTLNASSRQQIDGISCNLKKIKDFHEGSTCWLCEGWSPVEFTTKLPEFLDYSQESKVYLHAEFNDYIAVQMKSSFNTFTKTLMCPSNQDFKYFMTTSRRTTATVAAATSHNMLTFIDQKSQKKDIEIPEILTVSFPSNNQQEVRKMLFELKQFNVKQVSHSNIFDENYYQIQQNCTIRESELLK